MSASAAAPRWSRDDMINPKETSVVYQNRMPQAGVGESAAQE